MGLRPRARFARAWSSAMISGVNVGASVGKDKEKIGEAKRAKANITML